MPRRCNAAILMRISGPSIRKSTGAHFRPVGTEPSHLCGAGVPLHTGRARLFLKDGTVQTSIGKKASVGPYARLRPGTSLGEGVRIGNFVETKAATIEAGAKVNHLSYVGDAHVGANANLGAGTIIGYFLKDHPIYEKAMSDDKVAIASLCGSIRAGIPLSLNGRDVWRHGRFFGR